MTDEQYIPLSVLREYMPKLKDEDLKELGPVEYDQSKVPEVSKKHAENVRRKVYLPDMTESFARGVEYAGLIANEAESKANNSDLLSKDTQNRFDRQIADSTYDDEVIDARDGEVNLYHRLKSAGKTHNTIHDLRADENLAVGDIVETKGYDEIGDGCGQKYIVRSHTSYDVKRLVPGNVALWQQVVENETDDGGILIKLENGYTAELIRAQAVSTSAFGIYGTQDDNHLKFQKLIDYAVEYHQDVLVDTSFTLTDTVYIERHTYDRQIIKFKGQGVISKVTPGYMFSSRLGHRNSGNILFDGIKILSVAGAGTIFFDAGNMLRMYFNAANFVNLDHLIKIPEDAKSPNNYAQTVYLNASCQVIGGSGYFIDIPEGTGYDINFVDSLMEHREHGFRIKVSASVRILSSVIEGLEGKVFKGFNSKMLVISDNYFEHNNINNTESYVELDGYDNTVKHTGNQYVGTDTQKGYDKFKFVKFTESPLGFELGGNYAEGNLYGVTKLWTLTNKLLVEAFNNRVIGGKALNNYATLQTVNGSGAVFSLQINDKLQTSKVVAIGSGALSVETQGVRLTKNGAGGYAGFKAVGFPVSPVSDYVLGFRLTLVNAFSDGKLTFLFDNPDGTELVRREYQLSELSAGTTTNWISLPPVRFKKSGYAQVRVSLESNLIGSILFNNLVVQNGTIANPYESYQY